MTRFLKHALGWWAALSLAVAAYDVVTGGFHFEIAGIRISSFEAYKPFRNGLACACAAFWLRDREADGNTWWHRLVDWSLPLSAAAAAISVLMAIRFGIFVAGGSDAWGYVSQAALWASGRLSVDEPLAQVGRTLGIVTAPLGYRPALVPGASVPTYAAGFPMMMAVAMKVAGEHAAFFIPPICAGVTVFMTFLIGARLAGPRTGFVAAALLTCSPMLFFESLEPMSDLPVTMWFMVAWWMVLAEGRLAAACAGLATAAAILTRPNLAPLAAVLVGVCMRERPRIVRGGLYALGTLPGVIAVALINRSLYGTASMSGYGSLSDIYEWQNLVPNLHRYPVWLVQLHTPAILVGLLAPIVGRREPDAPKAIADPRGVALWMVAYGVVLLVPYLFYGVFEDWPYARFLLPVIPLLFVLSACVVITAVQRIPSALRGAVVFTICVLLGTWYLKKSGDLGIFNLAYAERRYESVGRYLERALPPDAAVLSVIQSGSIRLYAKRATMRWDEVPAGKLDLTLETLKASGHTPYILLEDWEAPMFRERFGRTDASGQVDWPPAFECRGPITVRIYDPADRARYLAGERWLPKVVPHT